MDILNNGSKFWKRIIKTDIKDYSRKKANDEGVWKGFNAELGEGDVELECGQQCPYGL